MQVVMDLLVTHDTKYVISYGSLHSMTIGLP